MKKTKKIVALFLAAVMLVCTTVAATVAYLTSKTEIVNNTFTVGNVTITLDEKDTDNDTVLTDNNSVHGEVRDLANQYHLMPGKSYEKDPTVWVKAGSEKCYVFVKVVNNIANIEATDVATIAQQMDTNGWKAIGSAEYPNVYYREVAVDVSEATTDESLPVFSSFKVKGDITNTQLAAYSTETDATKVVTVEAYAIQAEGFGTALAAWEAAPLAVWKA